MRLFLNALALICWLGILNLPFAASADEVSLTTEQLQKIKEISRSKKWLRLLHYTEGGWFSSPSSRADGDSYFQAKDGNVNPESEMIETIRSFSLPLGAREIGPLKLHPQCAFPERKHFIEKKLGLTFKKVECQQLDDYLKSVKAKSVSLIFSTAYANNPGSMFGHTFIKFNTESKSEILDFAVSYAAVVGYDAGIPYMVKGLLGGYPGSFALTPYYQKVNEYNNFEARDLWEYVLNLDQEQVESLQRHLWELGNATWFQYFFFDENCALMLLHAIESAQEDWDLSDFWYYVIPAESVKKSNCNSKCRERSSISPIASHSSYQWISRAFEREK